MASARRRRHIAAQGSSMADALTEDFLLEAFGEPPSDRAEAEARIELRRQRVDGALSRARAAANELQGLRDGVETSVEFDEARERSAMMMLVHALAVSHQELLSRYQELQMEVAISRSLEIIGGPDDAASSGVASEVLEKSLPSISFTSVLRGSSGFHLPGAGECTVCQFDLEADDAVRLLPCRHCFHTTCIDPWFERSTCCPTCRAAVC